MSWRLPGGFASPHREANVEALNYELLQESAATLGRLGRRLEHALAALRAFDAAPDPSADRNALVATAGEALMYYVVQREVCGMRDTEAILRDLGVPRDVRLRMGVPTRRVAP